MNPLSKVSAILVDPDPGFRAQLKGALLAVHDYAKVHQARNAADCVKLLNEKVDDLLVVFISYDFAKESIQEMIELSKGSEKGADSAYVLLLKQEHQNNATVANSLLKGVDGFLLHPYSVEALTEITKLARVIYKQRRQERLEGTVRFMVKEACAHIDTIASRKYEGEAPGTAVRELKNIGKSISELDNSLLPVYVSELIAQTEAASPNFKRTRDIEEQERKAQDLGSEAAQARLEKKLAALGIG